MKGGGGGGGGHGVCSKQATTLAFHFRDGEVLLTHISPYLSLLKSESMHDVFFYKRNNMD